MGETVLAQGIVIALRLVMVPSEAFCDETPTEEGSEISNGGSIPLVRHWRLIDHYLEGLLDVPKLSLRKDIKAGAQIRLARSRQYETLRSEAHRACRFAGGETTHEASASYPWRLLLCHLVVFTGAREQFADAVEGVRHDG